MLLDLTFSDHVFDKLNELYMTLQGKGFLANELRVEITSFQVKLTLFSEQLSEQNFAHFPYGAAQGAEQFMERHNDATLRPPFSLALGLPASSAPVQGV